MNGTRGRVIAFVAALTLIPVADSAAGSEIRDAAQQVQPLQILTSESFTSKAQIGIGIAVALNPEIATIATVKKMADMTELVMDEAVKATDFRNEVVQSHLLVISAEAAKLEDIHERDGNLNSPEAQAILGDLKSAPRSETSAIMFLAKSVFSGRMAYGVASHYIVDAASDKVGEYIGKSLPTGDRVEALWIGRNGFVRTHVDIRWKYLKALGEDSKQLTNALQKVLLQEIGKKIGRYTVESTLDREVDQILRDHPSIPEATVVLRLDLMTEPRLMLPMAQAALPAPVAVPAAIMVQADPVVSAASVQQQVIEEQHYSGSSNSGGASHSSSTSSRSEAVEHPTHMPSSISVGGSFTGGSGSTLYSRF